MNVNVAVGNTNATGMFFHAPYSAANPNTMPTNGAAVLALTTGAGTNWAIAGMVSEDGPSWTPYGGSEKIRAWDLSTVRSLMTEKGSMSIPVISTDAESMKTVFGDDAVTTTATGFTVDTSNGMQNEEESFVLYSKDGTDDLIWNCAHGIVTEISEVSLTPTGALIWTITVEGDWTFTKDTPA